MLRIHNKKSYMTIIFIISHSPNTAKILSILIGTVFVIIIQCYIGDSNADIN